MRSGRRWRGGGCGAGRRAAPTVGRPATGRATGAAAARSPPLNRLDPASHIRFPAVRQTPSDCSRLQPPSLYRGAAGLTGGRGMGSRGPRRRRPQLPGLKTGAQTAAAGAWQQIRQGAWWQRSTNRARTDQALANVLWRRQYGTWDGGGHSGPNGRVVLLLQRSNALPGNAANARKQTRRGARIQWGSACGQSAVAQAAARRARVRE